MPTNNKVEELRVRARVYQRSELLGDVTVALFLLESDAEAFVEKSAYSEILGVEIYDSVRAMRD